MVPAVQWSAGLAAMMFSLFQTVLLWQLNPHHWLYSYLTACADHGGQAPVDLSPFIPWQMSEQRKQAIDQTDTDDGCRILYCRAAQSTAATMMRYCGRDFADQELAQIRSLIAEGPEPYACRTLPLDL